jgi:hypothetical protein
MDEWMFWMNCVVLVAIAYLAVLEYLRSKYLEQLIAQLDAQLAALKAVLHDLQRYTHEEDN